MKKVLKVLVFVIGIFLICGCTNEKGLAFKEEYESVNGKANARGVAHRVLEIPKDNPYEKITTKELLEKIDKKETFYVYFGDKLCPWCRSVIEKSIEVAKNNNIDKIYYIAIWDDEGNEILRDKYEVNSKNKLVKTVDGTEDYYKLLKVFNELLSDYNLKDSKGNDISTKEKRIYAPNYFYVENGVAKKMITGISKLQQDTNDSRIDLTDEMLKEEEDAFNEFFSK